MAIYDLNTGERIYSREQTAGISREDINHAIAVEYTHLAIVEFAKVATSQADIAEAIPRIFAAYMQILTSGVIEPKKEQEPAVPVKKSVTDDYIICLEDGKKFKSLKRHLRTHYNLSPEEYREKWGLPLDYPLTAPTYSATRSRLAKENGLGRKNESSQ